MICWRSTFLGVCACLLSAGCVTPQTVKDASTARLQLTDSLDKAVVSLQQGMGQYAADKRALIKAEGRILIAGMAVQQALPDQAARDKRVNFDSVFTTSNEKVRPSVDHALEVASDIDPMIAAVQKRIAATPDDDGHKALRAKLKADVDDLTQLKVELAGRPQGVRDLETVIREDLNDLGRHEDTVRGMLGTLRAQVALMKGAAATVDRWLQTDVTVTQAQVDSLTTTYSALITQLNAPAPAASTTTTTPGSN
jgi:hypothetical protein